MVSLTAPNPDRHPGGAGIAVTTQLESVLRIGGKLAPILSRTRRAKNGRYPRDARAPSGPTAQRPPWWSWGAAPMHCLCPCGVCGWHEVGLAGAFETIPRWRELVQSGSVAAQPAHGTVCAPCRYCAHAGTYWCPRGKPKADCRLTAAWTHPRQQHGNIPDTHIQSTISLQFWNYPW